jgi:hypothetical protein
MYCGLRVYESRFNKFRQLKCIGDANNACEICTSMGVECVRSSPRTKHTSILQDALSSPSGHTSIGKLSLLPISADQTPGLKDATPLGHLPTGEELEELIHLYFASVHRTYPVYFSDLADSRNIDRYRFWFCCVHSSTAFQSPPRRRKSPSRIDSYDGR